MSDYLQMAHDMVKEDAFTVLRRLRELGPEGDPEEQERLKKRLDALDDRLTSLERQMFEQRRKEKG